MTDVPSPGPAGRLPRHVWVLLALFVLVLGFALGGSLRAAFAAPAGAPAVAPEGSVGEAQARTPVAQIERLRAAVHRIGAPGARAGTAAHGSTPARLPVGSPSHRGKALPEHSGSGRRIVYQESTMHLWVVDADGSVIRDYPVTGRPGWPRPDTYHVFSKTRAAASPKYGVTFDWMVRFAHGNQLNIGFHDIPRITGTGIRIQAESALGAPIGHGGCVRQRTVDAKWLYGWATVGTPVVVLR